MDFKEHLQLAHQSEKSIKEHLANVGRFQKWAAAEQLKTETANYRDLLGWVQHLKTKKLAISTVNNHLSSLTKYYSHLIEAGKVETNPANRLRIKGQVKKVYHNQLKPEQLDELYEQIKAPREYREQKQIHTHQRTTVLLSLHIYQAARSGELKKLEVNHIDLDKGEIYLPSGSRSNSRTLKLHPGQILPLYSYIHQTRSVLGISDEKMFRQIDSTLMQLTNQLLCYRDDITLKQIRASVIISWVRQHGLRKAQQMAGHKYISSTEHYRQQDMESLQNALLKYHPTA